MGFWWMTNITIVLLRTPYSIKNKFGYISIMTNKRNHIIVYYCFSVTPVRGLENLLNLVSLKCCFTHCKICTITNMLIFRTNRGCMRHRYPTVGFCRVCRVLAGFGGFCRVLSGYVGLCLVMSGFVGFCRVMSGTRVAYSLL